MVISWEAEKDRAMEGWLLLVRSNRLGLQKSRKRYFVLQGNTLHCYKSAQASNREHPARSVQISPSTRVVDQGRECILKNIFHMFTLHNFSNPGNLLKLGARSSEEAARWIKSLLEAAHRENQKKDENIEASPKRSQPHRSNHKNQRATIHSIDWTVFASVHTDPMTFDAVAPTIWTIIGCRNGLRLFREAKDAEAPNKNWEDHPAVMAVGVVDADTEAIFQTLMSLGRSRSEWDFCLSEANVVERLDVHTDFIHKKLRSDWLPWGMKRRDLVLRRYWRKEDDGTYVIIYNSVVHEKCQPEKGYGRAWLKSGGYEISPVNQGKQSLVKHMLAIDWKFWKSYIISSSSICTSVKMVTRVAALREFFRTRQSNADSSSIGLALKQEIVVPQIEKQMKLDMASLDENSKIETILEETALSPPRSSNNRSDNQMNEVSDEFFDVLAETENAQAEKLWPSDGSEQPQLAQDQSEDMMPTTDVFTNPLHDIPVQEDDCAEVETTVVGSTPCKYGTTLPKDTTGSMPSSWGMAKPSTFIIRGESYLRNHQKVKADGTLMQLVGADWIKSNKREDDLGSRPGGIVQEYAAEGGSQFFFIVHLQVPGATQYSLALYYMMDTPLQSVPLLRNFVNGDDAYRNARFKLVPFVARGSWIVKQSVGKKACILGQALDINYFRGSNYIEVAVDVGSSAVAKSIVSLVIGYLNSLVVEMAFLIQAETEEELPEVLLGTCRLNQLDICKAFTGGASACLTWLSQHLISFLQIFRLIPVLMSLSFHGSQI